MLYAQGLTTFVDSLVLKRLSPLNGAAMSVLVEEGPAGPASQAEHRLAEQLQRTVYRVARRSLSVYLHTYMSTQDLAAEGAACTRSPHLGCCFYTNMPRLHKAAGACTHGDHLHIRGSSCLNSDMTPAERTANNMDKTALFQELLRTQYGSQSRIFYGELQFAFIAFVLGQSLHGVGRMF